MGKILHYLSTLTIAPCKPDGIITVDSELYFIHRWIGAEDGCQHIEVLDQSRDVIPLGYSPNAKIKKAVDAYEA